MKKHTELVKGSVPSVFFHYLITSVGGMLGQALYVLGDTIIVGRVLGAEGLAALNISIPVINLFYGVGLLLGIGGSTALSVDRGRGKPEEGNQLFSVSMTVAFLFGLLLVVLRIFFLEEISSILGADAQTLPMSMDYLGTLMWFSPAFLVNIALMIFVRNDGSSGLAMASMLTGSIMNVLLDYLFMVILGWGMLGGAFATGLSPVIGIIILSTHFIRKKHDVHFVKVPFDKIGVFLRRISSNGLSSFIIELSAGIVIFTFNQVLLGLEGNSAVSAYSIIANLSLIGAAIFTGVSQAIQPLVSVNFGAGKETRTLETVRLGLLTAAGIGAVFFAIGFLFPRFLMNLFIHDSGEISDMVIRGIRLYFTSFFLMGVNMVMTSYKQSKERARGSLILSLARGLVLVLLFLFLLSKMYGVDGVWLTMPATELATFIFSIWGFKECRKAAKYTIQGVILKN